MNKPKIGDLWEIVIWNTSKKNVRISVLVLSELDYDQDYIYSCLCEGEIKTFPRWMFGDKSKLICGTLLNP